jgi:hypothetical protein
LFKSRGPDNLGAAVEGAYIVTDGVVQLTDRAGNIMRDHNGKTYSKKFGAGGTAKGVAGRLTKDLGFAAARQRSAHERIRPAYQLSQTKMGLNLGTTKGSLI